MKKRKKGMPPIVRKDGKFQNGVEGGEVKASLKAEMSFHTSLISSPAMVWLDDGFPSF